MSFSLIWANLSFTPSKGLITLRMVCVCARVVCVCVRAWCVCVRGGVCVSLWINKTPACFHFMLFQRAEQTACRVNTVLLVPGCEIRQTDSTHMSLPSHECVRACVCMHVLYVCVYVCVCVCVCVCAEQILLMFMTKRSLTQRLSGQFISTLFLHCWKTLCQ